MKTSSKEGSQILRVSVDAVVNVPRRAEVNDEHSNFELDGRRYRFWLLVEMEDEEGRYRDFSLEQGEDMGILTHHEYLGTTVQVSGYDNTADAVFDGFQETDV